MSRASSASLIGVDGVAVEVEVRISSQLPRVDIVGLPEAAVRESTARVRGAIAAVGHRFPDRRVTVNLAPAAVRKAGAGLDLPIAVSILAADASLPCEALVAQGFIGELALDGRLRPVRGALALALAARDAGCRAVIVPVANAVEAALAPNVEIFGAADLGTVLAHLTGHERIAKTPSPSVGEVPATGIPCISEVRGQEQAKRALEIAAAGGHGLLLSGPPGAGKTMLAARLPGLLPPLSIAETLEATRIHGAAGRLDEAHPVLHARPFRAPHHTASAAGLLGGGNPPRPGEVSLAHRGVLFLDELPEFDRRSLEGLRQVLEEHCVRIARATVSCSFPADFQLIAACNPCPCGWYGSARRDCRCDDAAIARYRQRISGPLLDRIDLHVSVGSVAWCELDAPEESRPCDASSATRVRVERARSLQLQRAGRCNARLVASELDAIVAARPQARTLLGRAVDRLGLSARAAHRALRVARTVADLAASGAVERAHMAEALSMRAGGLSSTPDRPT